MPKLLSGDHPSVALCGGGSPQACEQKPLGVRVQCPEGLCWASDGQPVPCVGWRTRQNGRSFPLGRTSKRHSGSFQVECLQVLLSMPTGWSPPGTHSATGLAASLPSPGHGVLLAERVPTYPHHRHLAPSSLRSELAVKLLPVTRTPKYEGEGAWPFPPFLSKFAS